MSMTRTAFPSLRVMVLGDGIICSIDRYMERIGASVEMNYTRWGISRDATGPGSGESFEKAAAYLKKWITERTAWMDGEYTLSGERSE